MKTSAVVVVGSINLDLVVAGPRIPSPGETVLGGPLSYRSGGKGANQAIAAHRAGADVVFFGAVGSDDFSARLLADLSEAGLDVGHVRTVPDQAAGVAMIVVDPRGENTIMVSAGANGALLPSSIARDLEKALDNAGALVLQCEIPLETALFAARAAKAVGVRVVLNASPLGLGEEFQLAEILAHTDMLIVNESEARYLGAVGSAPEQLAQSLSGMGPREVVVTLGGEGAVAATPAGVIHVAPFKVDAVDTTGAGDAFCGVLAAEMARECAIDEAIRVANAAGALATTEIGAQSASPSRARIDELVGETMVPHA